MDEVKVFFKIYLNLLFKNEGDITGMPPAFPNLR